MAITPPRAGGQPITFKDEGIALTSNASSIDATGLGIAATALGSAVTLVVPGGPGTIVYDETPTGSGTNFALAHAPSPAGSLILLRNGQIITAGGVDFTLTGVNFVLVTTLASGETLLAKQYTY